MPNSQPKTISCRWCGQPFTTPQPRCHTCSSPSCASLKGRFYKLKKRLESHPELLSQLLKRSKELSQKVSSPTFELKGRFLKLWNLLFKELRDKKKELFPHQRTYGLTHCKWCGEQFMRKSSNSKTCSSQTCRSYKVRYGKLKLRLKPYPKALRIFEERAARITSKALEGYATTFWQWYELFQDAKKELAHIRKFKKGQLSCQTHKTS